MYESVGGIRGERHFRFWSGGAQMHGRCFQRYVNANQYYFSINKAKLPEIILGSQERSQLNGLNAFDRALTE